MQFSVVCRCDLVIPSLQPRHSFGVLTSDVMLLAWVILEVKQTHRAGHVAGARARVIGRMSLLKRCQYRHSIGARAFDPARSRCNHAMVGRRQHVELPAPVAHGRRPSRPFAR